MDTTNLKNILIPNDNDKVYIPNEIFDDFFKQGKIKPLSHAAFGYSYYCLVSYLFRYCKYGGDVLFHQPTLKTILGYSPKHKGINKLIKKDGILDEIGYTETIRDIPLRLIWNDRDIEFEMYSDMDDDMKSIMGLTKNFKIKYPVKAFYRTEESCKEGIRDGTFYEIHNTHEFDVNVFIELISHVGVIGFYLYQFFKHKNNLYGEYKKSVEELIIETRISNTTLNKYIKGLEEIGHLKVIRQPFIKDQPHEERFPNTYTVI